MYLLLSMPVYATTRGSPQNKENASQKELSFWNEVIHLDPEDAHAFYKRGAIYKALGQYHKADRDYSEAIRLEPEFVEAIYNRGVVYKQLGKYQLAIEDYNRAISLDLHNAWFYNNRGGL